MNTRKLFEISPLKTLRFNLHYFGLRGLGLPVLVSRSTKLHTLRGGGYRLTPSRPLPCALGSRVSAPVI